MRTRNKPVDPVRALAERGDLIALVGTSTRVMDDCRLPNGALIDAPSHLPSYPVTATDGLACTPGLTIPLAILAGDALGRDERSAVLPWLLSRAEGFVDRGLSGRYAVQGREIDSRTDEVAAAFLLQAILSRRARTWTDPATTDRVIAVLAGRLQAHRHREPNPGRALALACLKRAVQDLAEGDPPRYGIDAPDIDSTVPDLPTGLGALDLLAIATATASVSAPTPLGQAATDRLVQWSTLR